MSNISVLAIDPEEFKNDIAEIVFQKIKNEITCPDKKELYVDSKGAMEILGCGIDKLRYLRNKGLINASKATGNWRHEIKSLNEFQGRTS